MLNPQKIVGVNPCYQCPDRKQGCHSTCLAYTKWRKEWQDCKDEIDFVKKTEFGLFENRRDMIEKATRGKRTP